MKVNEFVKLDKNGTIFKAVDANRVGYMSCPFVLNEADKNVIGKYYGDWDVVGFELATKRTMVIYIK